MSLIKRPPGDDFTFKLFFNLRTKVKTSADFVYLWSAVVDPLYDSGAWVSEGEWVKESEMDYRQLLINGMTKDTVVFAIKDHLTSGDFLPWTTELPSLVEYFKSLFEYFSDKKFIVLTSVENLDYYIKLPNVTIIPWGGDITNHEKQYKTLEPVLDKNFDSNYTYVSLNRNKRIHRAVLVSTLYGMGIGECGLVSCMFQDNVSSMVKQWPLVHTLSLVNRGAEALENATLPINDNVEIYTNNNNDNVSNFRNKLAAYYKETFVEIISETSFTERSYLLTEKTLNSIYGCNFPILLCGVGAVAQLREMGMDVFDDIVNHNYDSIEDPEVRLYTAIQSNIELLTNNARTKQLWQANKHRFVKNVEFARTTMYDYFRERATRLFEQCL